tara:strand:+ start:839 stop:1552 length:714 start_codon:yes stop_codon:yes gene_type:complete
MLRTEEQKQAILSRLEPTKVYENVVPKDLMSDLLEAWESGPKNHKNTGPVTYDYFPNKEEHTDWWIKTDKFVTEFIGDHWTFATNFYKVDQPHILHNDDSVRWVPDLYKTVVIPLEIEKPTNFAIFDQCYLDGPVKLRHGGKPKHKNHDKPQVYYNQDLLDNSELIGYTDQMFDEVIYKKYFTHLPIHRFTGLTVECIVEWKPGDIIVFDTARIHCAANFLADGIKTKLGYSIFTAK